VDQRITAKRRSNEVERAESKRIADMFPLRWLSASESSVSNFSDSCNEDDSQCEQESKVESSDADVCNESPVLESIEAKARRDASPHCVCMAIMMSSDIAEVPPIGSDLERSTKRRKVGVSCSDGVELLPLMNADASVAF